MGWGRPAKGAGMSRWELKAALGLRGKIGSCFSQREGGGGENGRVRTGQSQSQGKAEGTEAERENG